MITEIAWIGLISYFHKYTMKLSSEGRDMAGMEIRYDKAAVKFLQGLPQKLRDSIRESH